MSNHNAEASEAFVDNTQKEAEELCTKMHSTREACCGNTPPRKGPTAARMVNNKSKQVGSRCMELQSVITILRPSRMRMYSEVITTFAFAVRPTIPRHGLQDAGAASPDERI